MRAMSALIIRRPLIALLIPLVVCVVPAAADDDRDARIASLRRSIRSAERQLDEMKDRIIDIGVTISNEELARDRYALDVNDLADEAAAAQRDAEASAVRRANRRAALTQRQLFLRRQFENDPKRKELEADLAEKRAAYDRRRDEVLKPLRKTPDYVELTGLMQRYEKLIAELTSDALPEQRQSLAMSLLEVRGQRTAMENDAIEADESLQTLRKALDDAATALREHNAALDQAMRDDSQVVALMSLVEEAEATHQEVTRRRELVMGKWNAARQRLATLDAGINRLYLWRQQSLEAASRVSSRIRSLQSALHRELMRR